MVRFGCGWGGRSVQAAQTVPLFGSGLVPAPPWRDPNAHLLMNCLEVRIASSVGELVVCSAMKEGLTPTSLGQEIHQRL